MSEVIAIAGIVATLAGVVLGAYVSRKTAREIAQDERAWSDRQRVRERQVEVVARFDEALIEVMSDVPTGMVSGPDAADAVARGWERLRHAWQRTTILADRGIEDRIAALDMALFIAAQDVRYGVTEEVNEEVDLSPLSVAARDLRKALAAFQRREELPEPEFPSAGELVSFPGGRGAVLDQVREWLNKRGVM